MTNRITEVVVCIFAIVAISLTTCTSSDATAPVESESSPPIRVKAIAREREGNPANGWQTYVVNLAIDNVSDTFFNPQIGSGSIVVTDQGHEYEAELEIIHNTNSAGTPYLPDLAPGLRIRGLARGKGGDESFIASFKIPVAMKPVSLSIGAEEYPVDLVNVAELTFPFIGNSESVAKLPYSFDSGNLHIELGPLKVTDDYVVLPVQVNNKNPAADESLNFDAYLVDSNGWVLTSVADNCTRRDTAKLSGGYTRTIGPSQAFIGEFCYPFTYGYDSTKAFDPKGTLAIVLMGDTGDSAVVLASR